MSGIPRLTGTPTTNVNTNDEQNNNKERFDYQRMGDAKYHYHMNRLIRAESLHLDEHYRINGKGKTKNNKDKPRTPIWHKQQPQQNQKAYKNRNGLKK